MPSHILQIQEKEIPQKSLSIQKKQQYLTVWPVEVTKEIFEGQIFPFLSQQLSTDLFVSCSLSINGED